MKKTYALVLALALTVSVGAQSYFVCDGFNYEQKDIAEGLVLPTDWTEIDSITFAAPSYPEIKIVYNGTSASVTIPENVTGVTCSSETSSHVVLNSVNTAGREYLYTVSGTSNDGSLTINGSYKLTLKLAGISLKSAKGAAVDIECGKRIDVIVAEGTENTFEDSANGEQKAAFYAKGHVEFKGGGTLNVTGNTKHAIAAKEYLTLKASLGTLNIHSAVGDGIHCGKGEKGNWENNYFQMNGGTVTISSCGGDCIDSDDYGCAYIKGGSLTLNVSQQDGNGIKVDSLFVMEGGSITANVSGNISNGIRASYSASFKGGQITASLTGNGTRAVRTKNTTSSTATVVGGGNANFAGTNLDFTISGGTNSADATKTYGLKIDKILTQTHGQVKMTKTNTAAGYIKAGTDNWNGGTRELK